MEVLAIPGHASLLPLSIGSLEQREIVLTQEIILFDSYPFASSGRGLALGQATASPADFAVAATTMHIEHLPDAVL